MKKYIERNGLTLKVEVSYNIGGMNYFQGVNMKRGYYLSVTPTRINRNEAGEIVSTTTTAFSGYTELILETKRKSEKQFQEAIKLAEPREEELILATLRKNNA
jgi:hypothetical protein